VPLYAKPRRAERGIGRRKIPPRIADLDFYRLPKRAARLAARRRRRRRLLVAARSERRHERAEGGEARAALVGRLYADRRGERSLTVQPELLARVPLAEAAHEGAVVPQRLPEATHGGSLVALGELDHVGGGVVERGRESRR